jgi:hypothetical protein
MKQSSDKRTLDIEDIILWPDTSWCYRYELSEFSSGKSDDYSVIYVGTSAYNQFISKEVNLK